MNKTKIRRYRSGSSSDSAINFENIYEEDEDFLERSEDLTFYEDFFLMSFSFVNFGLQQKLSLESPELKRTIQIIKKYFPLKEYLKNQDESGFIISHENSQIENDQIYMEYIINTLINFYSKNYFCSNCENLKCAIREYGIPNEMRAQIWLTCIQAKLTDDFDFNGILKKADNVNLNNPLNETILRQIELDVTRTMPNHKLFQDSNGMSKLKRILTGYCIYINSSIGYCQGMNFICALLLVVFNGDEILTLKGFTCIINHYFPPHYYDQHLTGARADQMILADLIIKLFPDKQPFGLSMLNELTSALTLNWFLSLFHSALPWEIRLSVLDCFWIEGVKVIFRFSLALLKIAFAKHDFKEESIGEIINKIRDSVKNCYDVFELKKIAFSEIKIPKRKYLASQRTFYEKMITNKNSNNKVIKTGQWFLNRKKKREINSQSSCEEVCNVVVSYNRSRVVFCKEIDSFTRNSYEIIIFDVNSKDNLALKPKFIKNAFLVGVSNDGKRIIFCHHSTKTFKKFNNNISIEVIGVKNKICQGYFIESLESVIVISKNGIASKISKNKVFENIMLLNDDSMQIVTSFHDNNIIWVDAKTVQQNKHKILSFDTQTMDVMNVINLYCEVIYRISIIQNNQINVFLAANKDLFDDKKNKLEMIKEEHCKVKFFDFSDEEIIDIQHFKLSMSDSDEIIAMITKNGFICVIYNQRKSLKKIPHLINENTKIISLTAYENKVFNITLAIPSLEIALVNVKLKLKFISNDHS